MNYSELEAAIPLLSAMSDSFYDYTSQSKGIFHGLSTAARSEGFLSLWKGLLPRLVLKSFGSSIWYSVYMASGGR